MNHLGKLLNDLDVVVQVPSEILRKLLFDGMNLRVVVRMNIVHPYGSLFETGLVGKRKVERLSPRLSPGAFVEPFFGRAAVGRS